MYLIDPLIKLAAVIVAWFLVVLGWAAVDELTRKRERGKSSEVKLNAIRGSLNELEEISLNFHSSARQETQARCIVRKLKSVGLECSHLERCGVIGAEWRIANNNVRRAVTFKNFDAGEFKQKASSDEMLLEIEAAFERYHRYLMNAIEVHFNGEEKLRYTLFRILRKI